MIHFDLDRMRYYYTHLDHHVPQSSWKGFLQGQEEVGRNHVRQEEHSIGERTAEIHQSLEWDRMKCEHHPVS